MIDRVSEARLLLQRLSSTMPHTDLEKFIDDLNRVIRLLDQDGDLTENSGPCDLCGQALCVCNFDRRD